MPNGNPSDRTNLKFTSSKFLQKKEDNILQKLMLELHEAKQSYVRHLGLRLTLHIVKGKRLIGIAMSQGG